jgi:quercetin dioxygenase-like cupin family protein
VPLEHFDYRTDVRNVFISPEIRSRFQKIAPGTVTPSHTHDVGFELWLVMEGHVEFNIAGSVAVLGPGQGCIAKPDEPHFLRVVGDQPATVYLSVTPHIEPTHTWWDDHGKRAAPRWGGSTVNERAQRKDPGPPIEETASKQLAAARALADAAMESARKQEQALRDLTKAVSTQDAAATEASLEAIAEQITSTYKALQAMLDPWNELAPRAARR